jgi:hypothetical protein
MQDVSIPYHRSAGDDAYERRVRRSIRNCFHRQDLTRIPRFTINNDKLTTRCAPRCDFSQHTDDAFSVSD